MGNSCLFHLRILCLFTLYDSIVRILGQKILINDVYNLNQNQLYTQFCLSLYPKLPILY